MKLNFLIFWLFALPVVANGQDWKYYAAALKDDSATYNYGFNRKCYLIIDSTMKCFDSANHPSFKAEINGVTQDSTITNYLIETLDNNCHNRKQLRKEKHTPFKVKIIEESMFRMENGGRTFAFFKKYPYKKYKGLFYLSPLAIYEDRFALMILDNHRGPREGGGNLVLLEKVNDEVECRLNIEWWTR